MKFPGMSASSQEPDLKTRVSDIEHKLTEELTKADMRINELEKKIQKYETPSTIPTISVIGGSTDVSKLESRIADLEHLLSTMEVKLLKSGEHPYLEENKDFQNKLSSMESNLAGILSRLNSLETGKVAAKPGEKVVINPLESTALRKDLDDLKGQIDSLKIRDRTIDTSVVRIEENVKEYLEKMNNRVSLKMIDMEEKLDKAFGQVPAKDHYEKNIELKIINMLSEKIEHFAYMMDKKLVEFPTRAEMDKRLARLDGMIAKLEHPDFKPLEYRLNSLELKMDDLIKSHEKHAKRIPMVVE